MGMHHLQFFASTFGKTHTIKQPEIACISPSSSSSSFRSHHSKRALCFYSAYKSLLQISGFPPLIKLSTSVSCNFIFSFTGLFAGMPCLYISTNVDLAGVDTDPIFSDTTAAVSAIIGKPEKFVMVILKGGMEISFGGNRDPAAFAEVVSMGGIDSAVKRNLISTISGILNDKLSIPPARFFLKVHDTTAGRSRSRL